MQHKTMDMELGVYLEKNSFNYPAYPGHIYLPPPTNLPHILNTNVYPYPYPSHVPEEDIFFYLPILLG